MKTFHVQFAESYKKIIQKKKIKDFVLGNFVKIKNCCLLLGPYAKERQFYAEMKVKPDSFLDFLLNLEKLTYKV